jgi:hypothetical protein
MKIKKSILRKIIREEAGHLNEGCPVDLPCPYAMADELKASGASPEELLSWVATLTQELVSPSGEAAADAEGVPSTLDSVSEPVSAPIGIALESRRRNRQKLSSRQLRNIIESVVGPGDLVRPPSKPVLPKKNSKAKRRSSTLRKRR